MREIKFRAILKKESVFRDVVGINFNELKVLVSISGSLEWHPWKVLVQYTGLEDKNGAEIFEGCVVRFVDDAEGVLELTGQVYWDERQCGFAEKGTHEHDAGLSPFCDSYEVIGNIYSNPELVGE